MTGQFVKIGTKIGTTYPERGDSIYDLVDDFYSGLYSFARSAGAATYGDNGYFNAIMGKEITAAMFSSDNVFTALGARPYNHEGVRIATELATYGTGPDGRFHPLGAGTIQDGIIPPSVKMPVNEFREPYKDLPFSFDYGLGLQALEAKDDTIAYKDYIDKMSANYSDYADKSVVNPLSNFSDADLVEGVETGLNSLYRVVSSHNEIGKVEDGTTITAEMASPYGGMGSTRGDFYEWRAGGESNIDSQLIDAEDGTLTMDLMDDLYIRCSVNWADSAAPNNKVWFLSNIAMKKLSAVARAQQAYLNSVYVQRDFNGVKTYPGRDVGILLRSYNNVPIIIDGNLNFDFSTSKVSTVTVGNPMLADLDHVWMRVLTPVEMWSVTNPAITRKLQEVNVMSARMELGIDSFIQHGKIIGLRND